MRKRRLKLLNETACYHITCRVVDRDFKFDGKVKRKILKLLRKAAFFSDVQIIAFAILSNHIHILVRITPQRGFISEEKIRERLEMLYEEKALLEIYRRWDVARELGMEELVQKELDALRLRMNDLSEFVKTFKQRVTSWFNKSLGRVGTLWEGRFHSILVQNNRFGSALRSIAAYIDLNPVRAGIVNDPAQYEFSSYGQACREDSQAREGLKEVLPPSKDGSWNSFESAYCEILYEREEDKRGPKAAQRLETALKTRYTLPEILRRKVRYFVGGLVIGDREFVNRIFEEHRDLFGPKRKDGARSIPHCTDWKGKVYSARDLRKDVIGPLLC